MQEPEQAWLDRRSRVNTDHRSNFNTGSPNSQYQRDRARIIHSSWFRALQSKTQVLGLGENDFYRTRLTHSMEVAQIGSGIVEHLLQIAEPSVHTWLPPQPLIESICLAHDLGHPPFGHGGEVALNYCMAEHGGFEGNGQTLRILSRLGEFSENCGIDVTRRTMLGVLKYPAMYNDLARYKHQKTDTAPLNLNQWHPPKCIYNEESDVLAWMLELFSEQDQIRLTKLFSKNDGHFRTFYKALDTSIMEIADDIAYGVHDLEDALALGLVSQTHWQAFVDRLKNDHETPIQKDLNRYTQLLFSELPRERKRAVSQLVHYFISSTEVIHDELFTHPLLQTQVILSKPAALLLQRLKQFVMDHVISRPELLALRHCGQQITVKLFETLSANPKELLPRLVFQQYHEQDNNRRIICDYLASLTDVSATKLHGSMFVPNSGSIFQRL